MTVIETGVSEGAAERRAVEADRKKAGGYLRRMCEETWAKGLPVTAIDLCEWAKDLERGEHAK